MGNDVKSFYDRDAESYDQRWLGKGGRRTAEIQAELGRRMISDWSVRRCLEIGPGTGRFSVDVGRRASSYVGADLSREMLLQARAKLGGSASEGVGLVQASVEALPFADGTFDAVFCVNVLNHVPRIRLALGEISRVLEDKGHFLINFTNVKSYFLPAAILVNRRGEALGKSVYSRWRSLRRMRKTLEEVGLRANELRGNVHVPSGLDMPLVRELLFLLDLLSRRGWLVRLAPTVFVNGTKIP